MRVSTRFYFSLRACGAPQSQGVENRELTGGGAFTAQIESNYDETTDSFDAMDLKSELLRGVYAYGFERPSAIQQRAIMPVIKGTSNFHMHT